MVAADTDRGSFEAAGTGSDFSAAGTCLPDDTLAQMDFGGSGGEYCCLMIVPEQTSYACGPHPRSASPSPWYMLYQPSSGRWDSHWKTEHTEGLVSNPNGNNPTSSHLYQYLQEHSGKAG